MKKKSAIFVMLSLLTVSTTFAKTTGTIPDWMNNSVIILSEYLYGTNVTIGHLFGKKPKKTTNTTITASNKELTIMNETIEDGSVTLRIKITFVMNKVGDKGTCYPSKCVFESPLTFISQTFSCSNPYNDARNYGRILGVLKESLSLFYEQ